ncbi:lactonase family protein [Amycolatopsis sp. NPDC004368]
MKRSIPVLAAVSLALTVATVAVPAAGAAPLTQGFAGHAVFVQTNDPAGNAVVVYDRRQDGSLAPAARYSTGGRGGALAGSVVDRLASQGALTYDSVHHVLYAVNAGSDTVTVFGVFGDRLLRLQEVSTGGSFPVSVAVRDGVVYVLNARNGGSVQGFRSLAGLLIRVPAWHRPLGLDTAKSPEFNNTPGQVGFTPDGTKLIVTTKRSTNSVEVFTLDRFGAPSSRPVVTPDADNDPFAFTFDTKGHLVLAEGGPNAVATFTVDRGGNLELVDRVATGGTATCWVTTDGTGVFAANAGTSTISRYTDKGDGKLGALGTVGTGAGPVDLTVTTDLRYLYAETSGAGGIDAFRINPDHTLTAVGTVSVPGTSGGEGIASS